MNKNALLLERFKRLPFGLWLVTRAICWKAPYFSTIRPSIIRLEPGFGVIKIKKRRAVLNHLGTVHAIAMANLCELVAGVTLEMTLPDTHRWIPKSMKINYLAKATSDVRGKVAIVLGPLPDAGSLVVHVDVVDDKEIAVVTADIEMYVSKRK